MSKEKYSEEFKIEAINQITERVYSVSEVLKHVWGSDCSFYEQIKRFSAPAHAKAEDEKAAEIRRLKSDLLRVEEERNILKKATAYFARDAE